MSERLHVSHVQPNLPPPEFRLHDPKLEGRIPTQLDERGLVDVLKLIDQVKQTVDPEFKWQSSFNDVHHLQWPSNQYASSPEAELNPREFRNLAISKIYVPRVFHNWVHQVTEPPPMPSDEVMRYRIEAQRVVLALFQSVRMGRQLTRNKQISDAKLEDRLVECFDEFSTNLERVRLLPREFHLVDVSDYEPNTIEDMFLIGRSLGKVAMVATVTRSVEQSQVRQVA